VQAPPRRAQGAKARHPFRQAGASTASGGSPERPEILALVSEVVPSIAEAQAIGATGCYVADAEQENGGLAHTDAGIHLSN
jgi:hypothetical protein